MLYTLPEVMKCDDQAGLHPVWLDARYLDPRYRTHAYLMEQKRNGRIRHLGFSAHGDIPTIRRFLEAYGKDMEFAQIELNWFDWKFQNAKGKLELLKEWNIPVWVMEPVRAVSWRIRRQRTPQS